MEEEDEDFVVGMEEKILWLEEEDEDLEWKEKMKVIKRMLLLQFSSHVPHLPFFCFFCFFF